MQLVCFIPARYQSSRFPGKPLHPILGKSMIQRTFENAAEIVGEVIVLTDDERIFSHVLSFGGKALMTSKECQNGTERICSVLNTIPEGSVVLNIQGDEPCVPKETIVSLINAMKENPDCVAATPVVAISAKEAESPHTVKCVFDSTGKALYFSRSLIPYRGKQHYKHIGLYAYRREFLEILPTLPQTPLQLSEDLEQLKILEHGYCLQTCIVSENPPSVDVPDDVQKVENYLCQKNTFLSQAASALP